MSVKKSPVIGAQFAGKIMRRVNWAVDLLQQLPEYPQGRNNGYCTVANGVNGRPLLIFQVGECPEDKAAHRIDLSQEKALRLIQRANAPHLSSWQSRAPVNDRWGGAVRGNGFILSFSGLPEDADEAVSLVVAVSCSWLTWEKADEIADLSTNAFYAQLKKLWKSR